MDLAFVKNPLWHANDLSTGFLYSIPVLKRCTILRRRYVSMNNGPFNRLSIFSTVTRHFVNLWNFPVLRFKLIRKIIAQQKMFAAKQKNARQKSWGGRDLHFCLLSFDRAVYNCERVASFLKQARLCSLYLIFVFLKTFTFMLIACSIRMHLSLFANEKWKRKVGSDQPSSKLLDNFLFDIMFFCVESNLRRNSVCFFENAYLL